MFILPKTLILFLRYLNFCTSLFRSFFTHKVQNKVYVVIICLNWNSKIEIAQSKNIVYWYWNLVNWCRVLYNQTKEKMQNTHQELVPHLYLILVDCRKYGQWIQETLKNKILLKRIIKNPKEIWLHCWSSLFWWKFLWRTKGVWNKLLVTFQVVTFQIFFFWRSLGHFLCIYSKSFLNYSEF